MIGSPLRTDVLFHLGPVPVSSAVAVSWGIMALLVLGAWLATRRLALRPSRTQVVLELLVETIDAQVHDTIQVDPAPYRALIGSIFLFVLAANWSGLVPGIEPPTAHLETDAALAGIVFFATIVFGLRARGVRGYLASFAEPGWLMVRLFGNVMSGVFVVGIALSLAGLIVPIPFMALDLLTGAIQAYIFSVLAMVFIGAAVHPAPPSRAPDAPASSDRRDPS